MHPAMPCHAWMVCSTLAPCYMLMPGLKHLHCCQSDHTPLARLAASAVLVLDPTLGGDTVALGSCTHMQMLNDSVDYNISITPCLEAPARGTKDITNLSG
jgi:hypothetical protein